MLLNWLLPKILLDESEIILESDDAPARGGGKHSVYSRLIPNTPADAALQISQQLR